MEKHKWNSADTITASRIIVSVSLIFLSLEEIVFYILYAIAGGMDALDGFVARIMISNMPYSIQTIIAIWCQS